MLLLLSNVVGRGTFAARPAAGINGRRYFATDQAKEYRDNGVSWDDQTTGAPAAVLAATPSIGGNYDLAHGLGIVPSRISVLMTSPGAIWERADADVTNVQLGASEGGITAKIYVWA